MPGRTLPPLEYLFECSEQSLQDLELASLNRSANCLKTAKAEWEQSVTQRECAGVARWLLEHREEIKATARRTVDAQAVISFPDRKRA